MKNTNTPFAAIIFAITIIVISGINAFAFGTAPGNDNFANAQVVSGIKVHIAGTNVGATKEAGEPDHAANVGGRSVWYKWTATMSRVMSFSTNRSGTNMDTLIALYSGTSLNSLQLQCSGDDINYPANKKSFCRMPVTAGFTYYIAVDGKSLNGQPAVEGTFNLDIQPSFPLQGADYDNDGITDLSVFRPSDGTWYVSNSSFPQAPTAVHWGTSGDIPVLAVDNAFVDHEYAVYRPSDGTWYANTHFFNVFTQWGLAGDIPVPANYLDPRITSIAVYRPSNGTWYINYFFSSYAYYQFGLVGDIPLPGHYTPDLIADIAVFRPSNGTWYFIDRVSGNQALDSYRSVQFGQAGDKPVPADYDGDGILDVAVYRPSTGNWYVLRSSNGQVQVFHWGIAEDIPTTGDFDGDGVFDFAVFRPSTGNWYINRSSDNAVQITHFGTNGDIPVTANRTF